MSVVVRLECLTVFIRGAFSLIGDIEDLAQLNVAPDLGPFWFSVAAQRFTIGVRSRLVILLEKEDLGNAIVRKGAVVICI